MSHWFPQAVPGISALPAGETPISPSQTWDFGVQGLALESLGQRVRRLAGKRPEGKRQACGWFSLSPRILGHWFCSLTENAVGPFEEPRLQTSLRPMSDCPGMALGFSRTFGPTPHAQGQVIEKDVRSLFRGLVIYSFSLFSWR